MRPRAILRDFRGEQGIATMTLWKTLTGAPPRIIAHRGASGYRPEHTLDAFVLGAWQGADAIEPDIVASRDGVLYARHDLGLARSTDIAGRPGFAARAREIAGQRDWWIVDFTSVEVDTLRALQPSVERGTQFDGHFVIPRLGQVLDVAREVSNERGEALIVDIEIKHPQFFEAAGIDVLGALHADLGSRGLDGHDAPVWLESFDHEFLKRAHERCGNRCFALLEMLPDLHARTPLLRGLREWSRGVAPAKYLLWDSVGGDAGLVDAAHAQGLEVHAWTFRDDRPPAPFASAREELFAAFALGVDALFCDFPDSAVAARAAFAGLPPDSRAP
jgi:glycerophosphoryl diester phosphodiesterase